MKGPRRATHEEAAEKNVLRAIKACGGEITCRRGGTEYAAAKRLEAKGTVEVADDVDPSFIAVRRKA